MTIPYGYVSPSPHFVLGGLFGSAVHYELLSNPSTGHLRERPIRDIEGTDVAPLPAVPVVLTFDFLVES
ncbi:hypothetical protein [Nocardiopsis rhodophaea]|uniref:hypothetical protein n=1 Tax=Nocardiopsis rhodophaea TaxID=280238 RepID=UPI0031D33987